MVMVSANGTSGRLRMSAVRSLSRVKRTYTGPRPSPAKIASLSSQNHLIFCRLPDGTNLCFSNCVKVHGRGEGFVPTADDYRRLAAECLQLSSKISAELRCIFIALAHGWAHLAHRLEEKDRAAGESAADE